MSLRLEMLQVARLAPKVLGDSAELIGSFLLSQQHPEGGFKDREGNPDLYYTVFGLDGLIALRRRLPFEPVTRYLRSFGDGGELDLVHRCCLARSWAAVESLDPSRQEPWARQVIPHLERFRSEDGGYHPKPGSRSGTAYGAFLALGAYEDARHPLPAPERLAASLQKLTTPDGVWTNERVDLAVSRDSAGPPLVGATNATAAAVLVLRHLSQPVARGVGDWLLRQFCPQGGFRASPATPMPDLLSTATALHALAAMEMPIAEIRDLGLDFLDSLWTNAGSFHGHWADSQLDCEYTFYGLLAAGHLC